MQEVQELAAPVAHNQFPAKVLAPDGTVTDQVRAVVTPRRLYVYAAGETSGGASIAYTAFTVDFDRMRPDHERSGWVLETADGDWRVRRGSGCGCSSPLRYLPDPPPANLPAPV